MYSDYSEINPLNKDKRQICLLSLQAVFLTPAQRCCINSKLISVNNFKCYNYASGNAHPSFNQFQYLSSISICCRHFCFKKTSREGAESTKEKKKSQCWVWYSKVSTFCFLLPVKRKKKKVYLHYLVLQDCISSCILGIFCVTFNYFYFFNFPFSYFSSLPFLIISYWSTVLALLPILSFCQKFLCIKYFSFFCRRWCIRKASCSKRLLRAQRGHRGPTMTLS